MTKSRYCVYGLFDPVTKSLRYVGLTNNLKRRLREHRSRAESGRGKTHKDYWLRKLYAANLQPVVTVFEKDIAYSLCDDREVWWIAQLRSQGHQLTNHHDGGRTREHYVPSEETIQKLRAAMLGKPKSQITRERLSRARRGMKASSESRQKMSEAHRGLRQSPEVVAKTAAAHRGRKRSDETRAKMVAIHAARRAAKELEVAFKTDKVCNACGVLKPLDQFSRNRTVADGHNARCHACRRLAQRK